MARRRENRHNPRRFELEPLEPRMMLSAVDLAAAAPDALLPAVVIDQAAQQVQNQANAFSGTMTKVRMPSAVVTGESFRGSVRATFTNDTGQDLKSRDQIEWQLVARPQGGGDDVVLATRTQGVGNWRSGANKNVALSVRDAPALPVGTYDLLITGSYTDSETQTTYNGQATVDEDAQPVTLAVADAFVDMETGLGRMRLSPMLLAGQLLRGTVQVGVTNNGNVDLPNGQLVDVQVFVVAEDGGQQTLIGESLGQSVSNLKVGKTKNVNIKINFANALATGDYDLRVVVSPSDGLVETHQQAGNNTADVGDALTVRNLSPDDVAGMHLLMQVKGSTGDLAGRGRYEVVFAAEDDAFARVGDGANIGTVTGTFAYTPINTTTCTVTYTDASGGPGWTSQLTFTSLTKGEFTLTTPQGDTQTGTFTVDLKGPSTTPDSVAGMAFDGAAQRGRGDLQLRGPFRLVSSSDGSYLITSPLSNEEGQGTYEYYPADLGVGFVVLDSAGDDPGVMIFNYRNNTSLAYTLGSLNTLATQWGRMTQDVSYVEPANVAALTNVYIPGEDEPGDEGDGEGPYEFFGDPTITWS
jgi:hypothetical protein